VATLRLRAAGIAPPEVFVTAEDVIRGKPAPDGYLAAAARLGVPPAECVVIEDSPPGVAAGKAAEMRVIAVATTHEPPVLSAADWCVGGLQDVRLRVESAGIMIERHTPR
jgi:sugar-phosphatase